VGGMKILRWLVEEAKAIASVTLYFAACFVVIMFVKQLWLAEYGIEFSGIATGPRGCTRHREGGDHS